MTELREGQIRRAFIGWRWRLHWRQGTFITFPGRYPDDQSRHRCEGWHLTRRGAELAAHRHYERHLTERRRPNWRNINIKESHGR